MQAFKRRQYISWSALAGTAMAAAWVASSPSHASAIDDDPYANMAPAINLTGVIRDFRDRQTAGGHPDFNMEPETGLGLYAGIVRTELNEDGDPVFLSRGYKVTSQWRDVDGNNIMPRIPARDVSYIETRSDDQAGTASETQGGALQSADSFQSWFRDVYGVNMSGNLTIELRRVPGTQLYVFDDSLDTQFVELEGFYNPNGKFPNAQGGNKNWSFTYEVETEFVYREGGEQKFTFAGDDDLWVFIDGKLVIDAGGVHGVVAQTVELDRLGWLQNNESYQLKIFFAERRKPQSRCRIETNLNLRSIETPAVTGLFD